MVLTGEEAIIYLYTLSDKTKKFEVNQFTYTKGGDDYKPFENNEDEDEDEGKKEEVQEEQHEKEPEQNAEQSNEQNEQGSS